MIEETYRIGNVTCSNRTEYEAGKRDQEKIRGLIARIDINNPEEAMSLYEKLMANPYYFESSVGEEFVDQLLLTAMNKKGKKKGGNIKKHEKKQDRLTTSGKQEKKERKYERKKTCKTVKVFIALLLAVLIYSLSQMIYYYGASYISQKKIDDLVACILTPIDDMVSEETKRLDMIANGWNTDQSIKEEDVLPKEEVLYKYSSLYDRNSDLAGWIQIPGTIVNYPVMQCMQDEEFYLKRDFDKKSDINGLPFMDTRCNIKAESFNALIYGHNMRNGSMFTSLLKYKDVEFYRQHPRILFDTIYEEGEYEIFSAFLTEVAYQDEETFRYYNYAGELNKQEFEDFIDQVKEQSIYETGITAEYGDHLLTLSTCDRSIKDGRFVVVARKKTE